MRLPEFLNSGFLNYTKKSSVRLHHELNKNNSRASLSLSRFISLSPISTLPPTILTQLSSASASEIPSVKSGEALRRIAFALSTLDLSVSKSVLDAMRGRKISWA